MGRSIVNEKKMAKGGKLLPKRKKYTNGGVTYADLDDTQKVEYDALPDDASKLQFLQKLTSKATNTLSAATTLGAAALPVISKAAGLDESPAGRIGTSVASGALAGAAFGPIGMGAGALISGVSAFMGEKERKKAEESKRQADAQARAATADTVADASYRKGGKIKLKDLYVKGGKIAVKPYQDGGKIVGKGTGTSDSIKTKMPKGAFVVPAANAKKAEAIRAKYLGESTKKMNTGGSVPVAVSNGEHVFTPDEVVQLTAAGVDLNSLAPEAEPENQLKKGGGVGQQQMYDAAGENQKEVEAAIKQRQADLDILKKNPIIDPKIVKAKEDEIKRLIKLKENAGNINYYSYDKKAGKYVYDKEKASGKKQDNLTQLLSNTNKQTPASTAKKNDGPVGEMTLDYTATDSPDSGQATKRKVAASSVATAPVTTEPKPATAKKLPAGKKTAAATAPKTATTAVSSSPAAQASATDPTTGAPKLQTEAATPDQFSLLNTTGPRVDLSGAPIEKPPGTEVFKKLGSTPGYQPTPEEIASGRLALHGTAEATASATPAPNGTQSAAARQSGSATAPNPGESGETGFTRGIGLLGAGQAAAGITQLIMDGERPEDTVDRALQQRADEAIDEAKLGMNVATKMDARSAIELNRRGDMNAITNAVGTDTGSGVAALLSAGHNANRARVALAAEEEAVRERKNLRADQLVGRVADKKEKIFNDKLNAFIQNQMAAADLTQSGINNIVESRRLANYNKNLSRVDPYTGRITSTDINSIPTKTN